MLSFSNLSFEPATGVVQLRTGDLGLPRVSLRVCYAQGTALFVINLPHEDAVFYDAETIVRGLCEGANELDLPLPAPVPFPPCLNTLTDNEVHLILDAARGFPRAALTPRMGPDEDFETFLWRVAGLGFSIKNPTAIKAVELQVQESIAQQRREAAQSRRLVDSIDASAAVDAHQIDAEHFVITRAPEALMKQLSNRITVATAQPRISWNFNKMQISDRMTIPANLAKRAQTAVHVYAARVGKRFHTSTNRSNGTLTVIRLESKQPVSHELD